MIYKFFGTPNMLVKERKRIPFEMEYEFKPLFRFDNNGEYITENPKLIEKLKLKFKFEEIIEEEIDQLEKNEADIETLKCKKCDFETLNQGELLVHHRKEHKKGENE